MGPLRTIIVAILFMVFLINFMGIQIGYTINSTIFKPKFIMKIFKEQEGYAQSRNLMFRLIGNSLPNGQDSIPYLEKAITEDWLEEEVNFILKSFFDFAKGNRQDTPIISFQGLKKKVVDVIDNDRPYQEKIRLVQYWFDPLPDEVRFEDFMSIDLIWGVRDLVSTMIWFPWILCGISVLIIALTYLVVRDWKDTILWIGSAIMTGGALSILLVLMGGWAREQMSIFMHIRDRIIDFQISESSANNLINGFTSGIIRPMNII
ncbi:MAG TPA: hypothetical protein VFD57_08500, partial [Clostridia bacterium]|nr:hypothetical protein [Clostridia bacterium]